MGSAAPGNPTRVTSREGRKDLSDSEFSTRPRALGTAVAVTVTAALPVWMLGALAVLVRRDLGFSESQLGAAVSVYFAASALSAAPGGRLAERVGAARTMAIAAGVTATALLGIATVAQAWWQLVVFLVLAGLGSAVTHPAANLALSRAMPSDREGTAFGIKQAAVPLATLIGGVAVPVVGTTVGWRWAFAGAAVGAVVLAATVPHERHPSVDDASSAPMRSGDASTGPLVVLATAAGFGVAAASAMTAFWVESATDRGLGVGTAGVWFAVASACGMAARVLWGWQADHRGGHAFRTVAWLLAGGALGLGLVGVAGVSRAVLAVGTVLGFAAGWGWNGLFTFAVVRWNPNAPAAATGITSTGKRAGGVVGPLAFGALVQRASYEAAWWAAAGALVVAAVLVGLGGRLLDRDGAPDGAPR